MKKLLTLALILFAAPCFGESYLCIGEKTVGFEAKDNYSINTFNSQKWIVRRPTGEYKDIFSSETKWVVFKHGVDTPSLYCETVDGHFNPLQEEPNSIFCKGIVSEGSIFWMSKQNLRFSYSTMALYVAQKDVDDPYIEIGKCSKL